MSTILSLPITLSWVDTITQALFTLEAIKRTHICLELLSKRCNTLPVLFSKQLYLGHNPSAQVSIRCTSLVAVLKVHFSQPSRPRPAGSHKQIHLKLKDTSKQVLPRLTAQRK